MLIGLPGVETFSVLADSSMDLLHSIFENPYATNTTFTGLNRTIDEENFNKMKLAYNTCMDEKSIRAYGVEPIQKVLEEFEKVYPVNPPASSGKSSNEELAKALVWLSQNRVKGVLGAVPDVSLSV
jgi:endothelin-converting enzyme